GLIQEITLLKEEEENHVLEISANNVRLKQDIVSLYKYACDAE
ncbi:13004_t:CDS:1, partial [Funneliformis geosporum]